MDDKQAKLIAEHMQRFLVLCQSELGLTLLPKITWVIEDGGLDGRTFGRYVPAKKSIDISIRNRHPMDIMRTLAHELVHYAQAKQGRLRAKSGQTGSTEENEANSKAGVIMRKFARMHPEAFDHRSLP